MKAGLLLKGQFADGFVKVSVKLVKLLEPSADGVEAFNRIKIRMEL